MITNLTFWWQGCRSLKRTLTVVVSTALLCSLSTSANAYNYGKWLDYFFDRYNPSKDQKNEQEQVLSSITGIVLESGGEFDNNLNDYDVLLKAVLAAGLEDFLADESQDLTVFAPNDKAFLRLARDLGYEGYNEAGAFEFIVAELTALGNGDPIPLLTDILSYHVVAESLYFSEVVSASSIETALGSSIVPVRHKLVDNEPELADARIQRRTSNIKASNGIIHTVSRVLIPVDLDNTPADADSITALVAASGGEFDRDYFDYDLLLNAVLAAGLEGDLATLQGLTVFAPNDLAFIRLARVLGYHGFKEQQAFEYIVAVLTDLGDGDPIPLLTQVLLYHVAPVELSITEVVDGGEIDTLQGATITPDGRSLQDQDPGVRDPRLYLKFSDLRAGNGLVHTISRVLLPINVSAILGGN
ncbi:MAG: fasciclin domain-containing protein [Pseudomonadales bacterium]